MKSKELNNDDLVGMLGELLKNSPKLLVKNNMDLLTPQEVCAIYPCFNDGTLREATKNQLPYLKIGKHRFYRIKDIDEWLDKRVIIEEN